MWMFYNEINLKLDVDGQIIDSILLERRMENLVWARALDGSPFTVVRNLCWVEVSLGDSGLLAFFFGKEWRLAAEGHCCRELAPRSSPIAARPCGPRSLVLTNPRLCFRIFFVFEYRRRPLGFGDSWNELLFMTF